MQASVYSLDAVVDDWVSRDYFPRDQIEYDKMILMLQVSELFTKPMHHHKA